MNYEMVEVSTLEEIQEEILRRANGSIYLRLEKKDAQSFLL